MRCFLLRTTLTSSIVLFPATVAFAAARDFKGFVAQIVDLINMATIVLFSAAILFFFISVAKNMFGQDGSDSKKVEKLNQTLMWGIIILFVMVSFWGIIRILQSTLVNGL